MALGRRDGRESVCGLSASLAIPRHNRNLFMICRASPNPSSFFCW